MCVCTKEIDREPVVICEIGGEGMQRKTYTIDEVARMLGVSRITVVRRVKDGTIPSIRIARKVLIPRDFIEELLKGERRRFDHDHA